ncbi:uncharacterized protein K444DRAFT_626987 [Hyaloscypha bicolor E]|uniref:Uncharacterized protein n=1 Tax=Hyaloscypha bicolor E TaxID=1095630 RepID=A0A2J6TJR5_9HELO|nr:uncharacterized protein K444DRAFT_626987 [Hyaloscypha bicolor E]PMD63254.1 hypothetical protein K444DRAFT_626987 [Hyaloscypha bicolor E]
MTGAAPIKADTSMQDAPSDALAKPLTNRKRHFKHFEIARLSFYIAGIQDVSTSKDIDAAMQLWRACVNETIKENKDFAWVAYCGGPGRKMDPHSQYIEISILFATLQARKYGKRWTSSELQGAETLPAQTQLFDRSADRESCRNSHESPARLILICEISFFRWQKEIDVANSWRVPD